MEEDYQQCDCPAAELLQAEVELCTRAEEARTNLLIKQQELLETIEDMELRVEHVNQRVESLKEEKRELKRNVQELKEQLSEEKRRVARYKSQQKDSSNDEIIRLEHELATLEQYNQQLLEERAHILEETKDLRETISVEQKDHARTFSTMKARYEMRITELENSLQEEQQVRQDSEHVETELESKLQDAREQINEKWRQVIDLQCKLAVKDAEINELVAMLNDGPKNGKRTVSPKKSSSSGKSVHMFVLLFFASIVLAYLCYDVFLL